MERNDKKKKGGGFGAWIVIAAIMLLVNLIGEASEGELPPQAVAAIVPGIVILAAVIAAVKLMKKTAGKRESQSHERAQTGAAKAQPSIRLHSTHPAVSRQSYSAPDPYCVVCDQTGEDHFARDRAQRIAQLDEWLKNGLIDKAEYRELKQRYETNR